MFSNDFVMCHWPLSLLHYLKTQIFVVTGELTRLILFTSCTQFLSVMLVNVTADLRPLGDVDRVHRAGADTAGVVLKEQHAGQELWVLVISVQDCDGQGGAGVKVLSRVHFLTKKE